MSYKLRARVGIVGLLVIPAPRLAPAPTSSWCRGRLGAEVVPKLARWFDADIKLGDSTVNDVRYTGTFGNERIAPGCRCCASSRHRSHPSSGRRTLP